MYFLIFVPYAHAVMTKCVLHERRSVLDASSLVIGLAKIFRRQHYYRVISDRPFLLSTFERTSSHLCSARAGGLFPENSGNINFFFAVEGITLERGDY